MFEFRKLLNTKSTIRYLAAKGTAGLLRCSVSGISRSPLPPAIIIAKIFIEFCSVSRGSLHCLIDSGKTLVIDMQGRGRSSYLDHVRRGKVIQAVRNYERPKRGRNLSYFRTTCPLVSRSFFSQELGEARYEGEWFVVETEFRCLLG